MTEIPALNANFAGLEVVAFESRHAAEIATLISRFGGAPRVAPALREVPLENNAEALAFGDALAAGRLDAVIFMTGVGTRRLFEVLQTRYSREEFVRPLGRIAVVARGPKPSKVLREYEVPITIGVPEPNTWREILRELETHSRRFALAGSRVAVQEYGVPNEEFLAALRERGVQVMRVPVYQWTLPLNIEPLREAVKALIAGRSQVVLFTSAVQVEHLLQVAAEDGLKDPLRAALAKVVVASVGPTCSERLKAHGISIDLEPVHPKMGPLVQETAQRAKEIMRKKSEVRSPSSEVRVGNPDSPSPSPAARYEDSRFMKACRSEAVDATPIWIMRQAGRYMKDYRDLRARVPFLELCKSPALVSEVPLQRRKNSAWTQPSFLPIFC